MQVWRYYLLAVRPESSDSGEMVCLIGAGCGWYVLELCNMWLPWQQRMHAAGPWATASRAGGMELPLAPATKLDRLAHARLARARCAIAAFQWDDFAAKNNAELNDNLGNFINRTLKFIYAR